MGEITKQLNKEEYERYIREWKEENKELIESGKCRKVFIENLPRYESGTYKGRINWQESSSSKSVVYFIFDKCEGNIAIIDYITKTHQIIIDCNTIKNYKMNMQDFKNAKLSGLFNHKYEYDENNPKRVDLRGIPKSSSGICWSELIGYKIPFYYDEICGEVTIVKYIRETTDLIIEYNSKEFRIRLGNFKDGKLGEMLGKINHGFQYNVGDIVNTKRSQLKILKCFKKINKKGYGSKCYKYECLNCGNIDEILQGDLLRGRGCNVCCFPSQKVLIGYNDMATTSPWIVKWLENKEDAYKYTNLSMKKINFKCNYCGNIKNMRICDFNALIYQCKKCGDKVSIGEKIMFNVLDQLGIKFKTEYSPKWIKPKRYDFYLTDYNIIIETHGIQHYKESTGNRKKPIENEQENDRIKKEVAIYNGVEEENYIVIDCRESEINFIKQNILDSNLAKVFDLNKINWNDVFIYVMSNVTKEVCNIWNSGIHNSVKIGKIIKIDRNSVTRHLKNGAKLGWTKYNPKTVIRHYKNTNGKSLICIETGEVFKSIQKCTDAFEKEMNLKLVKSSVSSVCLGKRNQTKGHTFKYISDLTSEEYIKYDIENKLKELEEVS